MNLQSSTSGLEQTTRGLFITEREFREEVIYFLIVDRFYDATSDEEERQDTVPSKEREKPYDLTLKDLTHVSSKLYAL